jgi:hypothetical protein
MRFGTDTTGAQSLTAQLVVTSAVSLFLEMALIRFINQTVQVIAYFNNFIILASFLGLGFGALLAGRTRATFGRFPLAMGACCALLVTLDRVASVRFDLSDLIAWTNISAPLLLPTPVVVVGVFCACFLVFATLGWKLGWCFGAIENRLAAYGYDLLGSILGVISFTLLSWTRLPPWVWFTVATVPLAWLLRCDGLASPGRLLLLAAGVALSATVPDGYYSPYYKIQLVSFWREDVPKPTFYSILVDKVRIQDAIDFDQDLANTPVAKWLPYYQLPYRLRAPKRVLVLGGGSGNDTAIALKAGAEHVDTVEVDPILVEFGYRLHPQRPYADPRVRAINDDARAFLRHTTDVYDLIVMNALDSHHQLPGLSTLRLESYIYTVEAFRDVRRHMNATSIFVVHLSSTRPWMGERLYWSLEKAFGREPALLTTTDSPYYSVAFIQGPSDVLAAARAPGGTLLSVSPDRFRQVRARTSLATDDWPHLYLAARAIPTLYYQVLGVILILMLLCFRRVGLASPTAHNLHFLLLGAAFMLLETRAITQFALLFGSTWIVNAIVVAAILAVIYVGNRWLLGGLRLHKPLVYALLFGSLLGLYFLPLDMLLRFELAPRIVGAALVIGTPVFLASLLFSNSFGRAPNAAEAFGANLVGVVVGGMLEYTSMITGLGFLYLIALTLYLCAWFADRPGHEASAAPMGV